MHGDREPGDIGPALARAVEAVVHGAVSRDVRQAADRLSARYRRGRSQREGFTSDAERLAYVITRMPATLSATNAVLAELRTRCPLLAVASLLDLGSGPGTALWAARQVFDTVREATLLEPDPGMVALADRLLAASGSDRPLVVRWTGTLQGDAHDLVVAGYLLNELPPDAQADMVDTAWARARGAVALIEPGTPAGYRVVLAARDRLIQHGATIVAPCPHAAACPLPSDDWCHFAARVSRSRLHRHLKHGVLPFEDEKFSYVVATRGTGSAAASRLIRRPERYERRMVLRLCGPTGVRDVTVPRSRRQEYGRARKMRWGDGWDGEGE